MPRFPCPRCRRPLDADYAQVGGPFVCPDCQARFVVPDADVSLAPPDGDTADGPFGLRLFAAGLIVLAPLPVAFLLRMPWLCYLSLLAASMLFFVGWTWFLLVAFGRNALQGVLVLCVPFYALFFAMMHWREAQRPFYLLAGAASVLFLAFVSLAILSGW